jgi:UDP-galactopyranose mutase
MFDYLVVGAGFAGSVLAERLASDADRKVLIVDKRPHIGGNAYDEYDDAGVLIHRYGPHIFHTNAADVSPSGARISTACGRWSMGSCCRSRSTSIR